MAIKSRVRKLSFDLLALNNPGDNENLINRSLSSSIPEHDEANSTSTSRNKHSRRKRKQKPSCKDSDRIISSDFHRVDPPIHENSYCELRPDLSTCGIQDSHFRDLVSGNSGVLEREVERLGNFAAPFTELRQRTANAGSAENLGVKIGEAPAKEESGTAPAISSENWGREPNGTVNRLDTAESLDWNRLISENSDHTPYVEKLPLKYFKEEIYGGNSLRITTSVGNERKRQRVYNTMFHVPWRCELLIDVGSFVCLDSFLSLLTIMPTRIIMTFWRFLKIRRFNRPSDAELSDFGCFVVLACGVMLLQAIDISLIYHIIRGQGAIKLYVLYNVLEIFDKLCQSFGGDILQVLFNSAEGVASCTPENMTFELLRFILDQTIAVVAFIVHSFVLLAEAITLSTCIVSHNNALLALLVSNNFAEIKSSVFKRFSRENLHNLVYSDVVERFHISTFIIFVLAQNILEAEDPWFGSFIFNAFLVYACEMLVDVIKHSFLAKFNEIKPVTYSEFLEDLCKQTLNAETEACRKNLTFVPLAPACVVIRVLTPVYAAHLPYGPLPWRLFWIVLLLVMTYIMLVILKIMVGMGLNLYATWYVKRCLKRRNHLHLD